MLMKEVKEVVDTVSVALANGQPEEAGNVVMQEVNHALLSMGVDEAMADKIDNFIILLFIIGIALLGQSDLPQDYSAYRGQIGETDKGYLG